MRQHQSFLLFHVSWFVCVSVYVCVSGLFYVVDLVPLANHYLICSTENCFVLLLCVDFILRFYVGFSTSTILIICVFIIVSNTKSNRFSLVYYQECRCSSWFVLSSPSRLSHLLVDLFSVNIENVNPCRRCGLFLKIMILFVNVCVRVFSFAEPQSIVSSSSSS